MLAQVLLLGTYHMANPGRDIIRFEADDVRTPQRQRELGELVERLARFQPTKICVERPPSHQEKLDRAYAASLDGSGDESADEVPQIAFRLARRCGLSGVRGIDDHTPLAWDEVETFLAEHPDEARRFEETLSDEQARADEAAARLRRSTVAEYLRSINEDEAVRHDAAWYADLAAMGGSGEHRPADAVADWYRRNIRIFSNLAGITEPEDRIFILYGAGHVALLRHLIDLSSSHVLVGLSEYV